jgi:hypothetical protein
VFGRVADPCKARLKVVKRIGKSTQPQDPCDVEAYPLTFGDVADREE